MCRVLEVNTWLSHKLLCFVPFFASCTANLFLSVIFAVPIFFCLITNLSITNCMHFFEKQSKMAAHQKLPA